MKVNNPNITPIYVCDYINIKKFYSFENMELRTKYFNILNDFGKYESNLCVEDFIFSLDVMFLIKLYKQLITLN